MERQELNAGDVINFKSAFLAKSKNVDVRKAQSQLPNLNAVNKCYDKIYRHNQDFKQCLVNTIDPDSQILQSSQKNRVIKKRRKGFRPYPCKTIFHYGRKSFYKHRRAKLPSYSIENYSKIGNEGFTNTFNEKIVGNTPYLFESEPVLPSFCKRRASDVKNRTESVSETAQKKTLHTISQGQMIDDISGNLFIRISGKTFCARITSANVASCPNMESPLLEKACERKDLNSSTCKKTFKEDNTFYSMHLKDKSNEFIHEQNSVCDIQLNLNISSIEKPFQQLRDKPYIKAEKNKCPQTERNQGFLNEKYQPRKYNEKERYRINLPNIRESVLYQTNGREMFTDSKNAFYDSSLSLEYSESKNSSQVSVIQHETCNKPKISDRLYRNQNYTNNNVSNLSVVGNAGNYQSESRRDLYNRPNIRRVSESVSKFKVSHTMNSNSFFVHKTPKEKLSEGELWERFEKVFRRYASTKRHSGEVIPRKISLEWMTKAGVVNNLVSEVDADEAFRQAAGSKVTLNSQEYKDFLITLTIRKKLPFYEIYRRMCGL